MEIKYRIDRARCWFWKMEIKYLTGGRPGVTVGIDVVWAWHLSCALYSKSCLYDHAAGSISSVGQASSVHLSFEVWVNLAANP